MSIIVTSSEFRFVFSAIFLSPAIPGQHLPWIANEIGYLPAVGHWVMLSWCEADSTNTVDDRLQWQETTWKRLWKSQLSVNSPATKSLRKLISCYNLIESETALRSFLHFGAFHLDWTSALVKAAVYYSYCYMPSTLSSILPNLIRRFSLRRHSFFHSVFVLV